MSNWWKYGNSDKFCWALKSLWMVTAATKLRHLLLGRKTMTNLDSILKIRDITLPRKVHYSQSYSFSRSHVWMWELDHKEGWALKNWCFRIVVLEKTLENPLDSKEMKPGNPKGNQSWIFIGRTDNWSWSSNTLATWCEEPTYWKRPWCWERSKAKGDGVAKVRWLDSITDSTDVSLSKLWEIVKERESGYAAVHGVTKGWTRLSDWTVVTTTWKRNK